MKMAARNDDLPDYGVDPTVVDDAAEVRETTPRVERAFDAAERRSCPDCFGWPCVCARLAEKRLAKRSQRRRWWRRVLTLVTRRRRWST